jgi:regulator of replication initiation timing
MPYRAPSTRGRSHRSDELAIVDRLMRLRAAMATMAQEMGALRREHHRVSQENASLRRELHALRNRQSLAQ